MRSCVLFLASCSVATSHSTAEDVTLVWMDPVELLPFGFESMAGQVQGALEQTGIQVGWQTDRFVDRSPTIPVMVLLLESAPPLWTEGQSIMGCVVRGETRFRTVFVFFKPIVATLGIRPKVLRARKPATTSTLSRAIAHVVVHETVHAFAPDAPHLSKGVLRSRLKQRDLLGPRIRLAEEARFWLLSGLTAEAQRARRRAGVGRQRESWAARKR